MPTFLTAYRWELRKLVSQKRTYLGLGAVTAVPLIFVTALALQSGSPNDVAFGRYVRESGLAIPLVLLLFSSVWLFPLVTALVAGDIIAAEDHNGTLKTILTRSLDRGQIFVGKMLASATYAALALVLMGSVAVVAGSLKSGFNGLLRPLRARASRRGHALGLVGGQLRRLHDPGGGRRVRRPPALGAHPKQRGGRCRDAHVRASHAADRDSARALGHRSVPPDHAVPGLAGLLPDAHRLGPDRARGVGVRDLRRAGRWSAPTWCSCGATSPAADVQQTGSDPDVAAVGFGCGCLIRFAPSRPPSPTGSGGASRSPRRPRPRAGLRSPRASTRSCWRRRARERRSPRS